MMPARPSTIQRAPPMMSSIPAKIAPPVPRTLTSWVIALLSAGAHVLSQRCPPGGVSGGQVGSGRRAPGSWSVALDRRARVQQRLHNPPGFFDPVLSGEACAVADHGGVQQHLVGSRPLPP